MAQQQSPYLDQFQRNDLINQMGGPFGSPQSGSGIQAPVDPSQTPIEGGPSQPAQKQPFDLAGTLNKYQYGAEGLAQARPELEAAGYQLQQDSAGKLRGRLKGPNGDIIDVIGQGEGDDWWNNQTGSAWNINNRGQEGLDAGGWSFGGGGQIQPSDLMDSGALTSQNIGDDDFFRRLMASLQQQAGPEVTDRQALIEMLGV